MLANATINAASKKRRARDRVGGVLGVLSGTEEDFLRIVRAPKTDYTASQSALRPIINQFDFRYSRKTIDGFAGSRYHPPNLC